MVGAGDGAGVGMTLGVSVGNEVGTVVGSGVGEFVGKTVGNDVGVVVGSDVGDAVGSVVGDDDGGVVGIGVGAEVGASTTTPPTTHSRARHGASQMSKRPPTRFMSATLFWPPPRSPGRRNATSSIASHAVGSSKVSASTAVCLSGL